MAVKLRNLKIDRVDFVDAPANPDARVAVLKRDAGAAADTTETNITTYAWSKIAKRAADLRDTHAQYRGLSDEQAVSKAMRDDPIARTWTTVYQEMSQLDVLKSAPKASRTDTPQAHAAWAQIEAEADKVIAKGGARMTRERAIMKTMSARPDLVREYYGYPSLDPAARR